MSADKYPKTAGPAPEDSASSTKAVINEGETNEVDIGLLCANLQLTPEQRLLNLQAFIEAIEELRRAVKAARK